MKFQNVTLYLSSEFLGGINRFDCREVEVIEGVKYAQYDNAVRIIFTEKRKRTARQVVITSHPFAVIVDTKHAIIPDSAMVPCESNIPGLKGSKSRYAAFDSRWQSDFYEQLAAANVPVLKDYKEWNPYSTNAFYVQLPDCRKHFATLADVPLYLNSVPRKLPEVVNVHAQKSGDVIAIFTKGADGWTQGVQSA